MAWRDPFVIFDEKSKQWIMYIAAKHNDGANETRGCIGLALSEDLVHWKVQPPILSPRKYREMECPVVYQFHNNYYMFVSVSDDYRVHTYRASNPLGSYEPLGFLTQPHNYAPRVIKSPKNDVLLIHTVKRRWGNIDSGEIMRGLLAQPKKLVFDEEKIPYLAWYTQIESFIEPYISKSGSNGILSLSIPYNSRQIKINLRVTEEKSERKGLEVVVNQEFVLLQYIEDHLTLQKVQFQAPATFHNAKVLLYNEYFEVYLNERLYISTMGYRHLEGQFEATSGGNPINFTFNPFKRSFFS